MVMTTYVTDYAWARPNPAAIAAAGFVGVCRYLSHDRTGKTLTKPEVDALHAAGLGIVLNFEDSAGRANAGYAAGVADAQFANQLATSLGAPANRPIYYSVDTDPGSPVRGAVQDYVHGLVAAGGRPVGIYGGAVLVQWALANGARYGWTANASSWNHGVKPVGHMHQLYGHPAGTPTIAGVSPQAYDTNVILTAVDFGAWGGTFHAQEEEVTPQDIKDIANLIDTQVGNRIIGTLQGNANSVWIPSIVAGVTAAVHSVQAGDGTVDADAVADAVAAELSKRLAT